jgi:phosphoribosylformimino-5-aminoimidazole carboxamide ribotide isomerase
VIGRQLLRCGTSVGANYRAACRARSNAEFLAKLGIVEEEADESAYWLELLLEGELARPEKIAPLLDEAQQLFTDHGLLHSDRSTEQQMSTRDIPHSAFRIPHFEIIPAIDIRAGKCVRLFQGDYAQETVFGEDPVEMARRWEAEGASRLHVVDLDAARSGEPVNLPIVERIAAALAIPVQMGGGVRDRAAVVRTLEAGVQRAIIGTAAAADPEAARALFSEFTDRLILGLDARDGKVAVAGWRETTDWEAVDLALEMAAAGARRIIYTDIATDGTGVGPSLESTRRLAEALPIPVIASGGVGSPEHIRAVSVLAPAGVEGVIVGKALYTGAVRLQEALAAL